MVWVRSTTLLNSAGLGAGARRCANTNSASASTTATENVLSLIEYLNDARLAWPTQTISHRHSDRKATRPGIVETQRAASPPGRIQSYWIRRGKAAVRCQCRAVRC